MRVNHSPGGLMGGEGGEHREHKPASAARIIDRNIATKIHQYTKGSKQMTNLRKVTAQGATSQEVGPSASYSPNACAIHISHV